MSNLMRKRAVAPLAPLVTPLLQFHVFRFGAEKDTMEYVINKEADHLLQTLKNVSENDKPVQLKVCTDNFPPQPFLLIMQNIFTKLCPLPPPEQNFFP